MEIKKTEKASLENKRLIFAEVGLIAALLVVFAGFESSTRAKEVALLQGNTKIDDEGDIMPIPLDDLDFQSLEDTDFPVDIQEYVRQEVVEEEVEDDPIPFVTVEQKPTFNGRDANEFSKWVNSQLVYPEIAKENGVEGRVILQFTIGKDGRLQDVKVLRTPDESLAQEAVRVVSSSPKWEPGRQRDRAVKVSYPCHLSTALANDRISVVNSRF